MKYKVGDKVKIKNNLEIDVEYSMEENDFSDTVVEEMEEFFGEEATIEDTSIYGYSLNIDGGEWNWTDNMIK